MNDSGGSEKPSPSVIDVQEVRERLRSLSETAAILVRERADRYTAHAAKTFAQLGRELNNVTGYGEIESLKRQVAEQGALFLLVYIMQNTDIFIA
jgi:sensitive to high expression protein 9, mitochondrial